LKLPKFALNSSLYLSEISVLFRRRRTWAMLATIALIPIALASAVALSSSTIPAGEGPPFLDRVSHNGFFVGFTALVVAMPLFLPLTIAVVSGDSIAGEANTGTLRYLLIAPVSRARLLAVKFFGAIVFSFAAIFTLLLSGLVIGAALFHIGPVTLLSGDVISLPAALYRLFLLLCYGTISMIGLSALGIFISTLTVIPVGAMAATVVISTVMQILDNLPQVAVIHPYLISHNWLGFADLLRSPMDFGSFATNAIVQLCYVGIFGALSYSRFSTKDILS